MPQTLPAEVLITRGGKEFKFTPTAYLRGDKAKAGAMYLTVDPQITLADLLVYYTEDIARNELLARLNLRAQNWTESASTDLDAAGNEIEKPFDQPEFVGYATEFSARGLSQDDIKEQLKSNLDKLQAVLMSTELTPEQKNEQATVLAVRSQSLSNALNAKKPKPATAVEAPATPPAA